MDKELHCKHCPLGSHPTSPVEYVCWAERFEANPQIVDPKPATNPYEQNSMKFPRECFVVFDGLVRSFWCFGKLILSIKLGTN